MIFGAFNTFISSDHLLLSYVLNLGLFIAIDFPVLTSHLSLMSSKLPPLTYSDSWMLSESGERLFATALVRLKTCMPQ